ncbi:MAG TPA: hypothetical protein VE201_08765 [Nitrospirales bacterium]|nr:hypothetical protein [Nitrospirales bacterium]
MRCLWKELLGEALLVSALVGLSVPALADVQRFTDEAGELLYTIDADGIVSMFENSPGTDVTLSVTRGTREQMQPQVTEVIPETVPAGSFTVLKLRGKNLVGAKVKLSVPSIEVKAHVGKPKELDVPINVPLDLPPGDVTIEVTTPIGRTTARFKATEVQIGGSGLGPRPDVITHPGQGYGADEGIQKLPTTAPTSCPPGMVGVAADGGGFCIELDRTIMGDYRKAEQTCALASRRLCRLSEMRLACEQAKAGVLSLKNMGGEWEWTSTYDIIRDFSAFADSGGDPVYFLLGKTDCVTRHFTRQFDTKAYAGRCCK